jgi:hypothetical protein
MEGLDMTEITQEIPEWTGDYPDKATMTKAEFAVAADTLAAWWISLANIINTWTEQVNALAEVMNAQYVASAAGIAAANFVGPWDELEGALNTPACTIHSGMYWMLLTNLVDVTASEPAVGNADWGLLYTGQKKIDADDDYNVLAAHGATGTVVFSNRTAAKAITFQLPVRTADFRCAFLVEAAQYLKVLPPAGERIYYIDGAQTDEDGYIRSNVTGTYWEIIGSADSGYRVTRLEGEVLVDE